jgi:uncharacterized membrane protein
MTDDFENLSVAELKRSGVPPKQILAEMKRRGMSRQEMLDALRPRPPISSRVGSRRLRRRVVVAMYGTWLLVALAVMLGVEAQGKWVTAGLGVLAVGALVTMTVAVVWLGRRTYVNSPQVADRDLDERLVQIKNQAYRTAFQIFSAFVAVAWPVSLLILFNDPSGHGATRALVLVAGVGLLVTTLPTAIVAWHEPDPVEPEPLQVPSRPR